MTLYYNVLVLLKNNHFLDCHKPNGSGRPVIGNRSKFRSKEV